MPETARPPPRVQLNPVVASSYTLHQGHIPIEGEVPARVRENRRVTAKDHFQDTRQIIIDLDQDIEYVAQGAEFTTRC